MIETIYRSNRVFESKDKATTASVVYEIGEIKSSIGVAVVVTADKAVVEVVAIAVTADKTIIGAVCTFDEAMQLINEHWEKVKIEAVNKNIDKELKEKKLIV